VLVVVVGVVVAVVVAVVVPVVVVFVVFVVPVVLVVVAGDAAACAGTTTQRTTGRIHLSGKINAERAPPPNATRRSPRRSIITPHLKYPTNGNILRDFTRTSKLSGAEVFARKRLKYTHYLRLSSTVSIGSSVAREAAPCANCSAVGIVSHETCAPLFFRQHMGPIFRGPEQSGYGDKRTS
jgi:hypothetical protein